MRYLLTIAFLLIAVPCFAVNLKTYTVCESGGGCDYTTLIAAESAHDQDLVANDSAITFEIQNTWASAEVLVQINGWVVDATRFVTVVAIGEARAGATWSTTAWRATHATIPFSPNENYTVVNGIQAFSTETGATQARIVSLGATIDCTIQNCFFKGSSGSDINGIMHTTNTSSTNFIARNNVIIDCSGNGIFIRTNSGGVKADNNTIENCGTGILTDAGDAIARNNILWNCTTPLSGTFNSGTDSEENYTDDASLDYGLCGPCGAGDQLSQSDPFEGLAGENYLLASGATAIDAGKDLSGAFTDAIGGKTRDANFDKGADEFIAAAGGKTIKKVHLRKVKL